MPWIETAVARVNGALHPDNRTRIDAEFFAPGRPMKDAFRHLGADDDERLWAALESFPHAVAEAFRAAVYSALRREQKGAITIASIASYDYGIEVYESQPFDNSAAGLTIVVRSRYPFDRHPASRGARAG